MHAHNDKCWHRKKKYACKPKITRHLSLKLKNLAGNLATAGHQILPTNNIFKPLSNHWATAPPSKHFLLFSGFLNKPLDKKKYKGFYGRKGVDYPFSGYTFELD